MHFGIKYSFFVFLTLPPRFEINSCSSTGADVNMQTCDGVTALHEASKNGHKEIVAMLLTKHADANKPTDSGLLPLHFAAQNGHHE